jgi:hypothetical protein
MHYIQIHQEISQYRLTMTQGSAETRTLDTKRCRQKVQSTSTTAARYVWNMYVCMYLCMYESLLVDLLH